MPSQSNNYNEMYTKVWRPEDYPITEEELTAMNEKLKKELEEEKKEEGKEESKKEGGKKGKQQ
jgi:hypothetical protein